CVIVRSGPAPHDGACGSSQPFQPVDDAALRSVERSRGTEMINRTHLELRAAVAAIAAAAVFSTRAAAQTVDPNMWVAYDDVNAIARSGNTLYIGGQFGFVSPRPIGGVALDTNAGSVVPHSDADGEVSAATPDGSGGWYIGGDFSNVSGEP